MLYLADGRNWLVWDLDGEQTITGVSVELEVVYTPPPTSDLYKQETTEDENFLLDIYYLNEDVPLPKATIADWSFLEEVDVTLPLPKPFDVTPHEMDGYRCGGLTFTPDYEGKTFKLKQAGAYCSVTAARFWPDGENGFPPLLSGGTDEAESNHKAKECMNRCLRTPNANGPAVAFYLRLSDNKCRCSYDCSTLTNDGNYDSYEIVDDVNENSPWTTWSSGKYVLKHKLGTEYKNMRCTNSQGQDPTSCSRVTTEESCFSSLTLIQQCAVYEPSTSLCTVSCVQKDTTNCCPGQATFGATSASDFAFSFTDPTIFVPGFPKFR